MNFPAHALVAASLPDADAPTVLGAMLPDLLPMVGRRTTRVPPEVERGRRLHHRCDEAFHAAPTFLALLRTLRSHLELLGVPRGARRGAAHAGYELLLDGALPWTDGTAALYLDAVGRGADVDGGPGWRSLLERLSTDPRGWPSSPGLVARRVETVLARRPRLALPPGTVTAVEAALAAVRPQVEATAADVVAGVVSAVAA